MKSNNYSAWSVDTKNYPVNSSISEQLTFIIRYGILAPSTFNSQPWQVKIAEDTITVYLNTQKLPKVSDKSGRFGLITMGCFIENIVEAAEYFGFNVTIEYLVDTFNLTKASDTLPVAELYFKKSDRAKKSTNEKVLISMVQRTTNRMFEPAKTIPKSFLNTISTLGEKNQTIAFLSKENSQRLVDISYAADLRIWGNKSFRLEHSEWVRNNLTKRYDGMPGFGVNIPTIPSFLGKQIILSEKFPKIQATKNINAINTTNTFMILLGEDKPLSWISIGRTFERIALYAQSQGLVCAPMGQFIEDALARKELKLVLEVISKQMPQMFVRIGYPTQQSKHSPRYPVNKILITNE